MAKRAVKAAFVTVAILIIVAAGLAGYYFLRVSPLIRAGKQQGVYSSVASRPSVPDTSGGRGC